MKLSRLLPALLLTPALAHAGLQFTVSSIGSPRLVAGDISGVNNNGAVLGRYCADPCQAYTPFVSHNGIVTTLPAILTPKAINDHGVVAGNIRKGFWDSNAVVYQNGQFIHLDTPANEAAGAYSSVYAINNDGVVAGVVSMPGYGYTGALFHQGQIHHIQSPTGHGSSVADINSAGVVAGSYDYWGGYFRAMTYSNGIMTDLGTLPGGTYSHAHAINELGDVAGASGVAGDRDWHAFLYSKGVMHDLGVLPGDVSSSAIGISGRGTVIGFSHDNMTTRPFLYAGGVLQSFDNLLVNPKWHVKEVYAINDHDQIGAKVCLTQGDCYLALLNPVPEPATYAMLLGGLGIVTLAARRRRPQG
jgi:probable HAF family extracellular repeat protein